MVKSDIFIGNILAKYRSTPRDEVARKNSVPWIEMVTR